MSGYDSSNKPRRAFWKTWATTWVREIKTAQNDEEFPFIYQGIRYKKTPGCRNDTSLLACPLFKDLKLARTVVFTTENHIKNSEILSNFITNLGISALLQRGFPAFLPPVPLLAYQADLDKLPDKISGTICKNPILLLFENDTAQEILHKIPAAISRLPEGSDVYIGNIQADLHHPDLTPTKKRVEHFLLRL